MSGQGLTVDPGFVHHRKIETIIGEAGTKIINEQIGRIAPGTPEWRKNVVIDHIFTRIMVDFCKVNEIKTLEQVLLDGCGRLFCSIVNTEPCSDLYDVERAVLQCKPFAGSGLKVELHLTTNKITGDTLRSKLHDGGEFAVIAENFSLVGERLIFHPLVIGFPYIADKETGELLWTKYSDFYQIYLEDFEEFSKVKELPLPESIEEIKGIKEKVFKACLGKILKDSTPNDWGGETSDFFSSHLHLKGERVSTAFLLKGPAKFSPMTVKHLGKNGDQIVRLAKEPADILCVQHCHDITTSVIDTLKVFATQPSNPRYYCLVDGRESLRLLEAYELKQWAIEESQK